MKDRRPLLYTALVAMLALIPVGTMNILWPHFVWQNEPLHSTIEAAGALAAIVMAIVLLQRQPDEGGRGLFYVAMGLLGAGILDSFHSVSQPGKGFVLLHSMAVLVGGFGFALVWLPEPDRYTTMRKWILWTVITGFTLFGIWTLLFRGTLPLMVQDGEFTTTARMLNLLSGVFFIAASGRFLLDFHRSLKLESYLFACMALLFGLASLTFTYSALWDDAWWFWHMVRLLAYLLVMWFVAHEYLQTASFLRAEITQRKQAEGRIAHLVEVLTTIRNVNQLITREKEREALIQKSCDLLVEKHSYEKAWIVVLDENRNFITAASAGLGEDGAAFIRQLETGDYPVCLRELLAQEQPLLTYDRPGGEHEGCIFADVHTNRGVFTCKLESGAKLYGVLGVTISPELVSDRDQQRLLLELGDDIALALANMESEEKRRQAEEEVRAAEERYRTIIQTSIDGFWLVDTQGHLLDVNDAYCKLTGYSRRELLAMSVYALSATETAEETAQHIRRVIETGGDHFESKHRRQDGSIFDIEVSVNYLHPSGLLFCFLRDITERKQAEDKLKQTLAELSRSNEELQRFAYVASHDLQEPLRTISNYLQLIEQRYKSKLDQDASEFIDFAVKGANRLQDMIKGLLEYSRITTRGEPFAIVDCESIIRQVIDDLQYSIEESGAEITHDLLPEVYADRSQLARLFQNLISNSIKYRSNEPPRIHVSAKVDGGKYIFSLRDNGIGIAPKYQEQLFVIFQRLHGREVPGIGLGLAIAKKILERLGGKIWIESQTGKGATFIFSIPNKLPSTLWSGIY